jgi:glycopeptide antibiotics resistance protein
MNDARQKARNSKSVYWFILFTTLTVFLFSTLSFEGGPRQSNYNLIPIQSTIERGICLFKECRWRSQPLFYTLNLVGNALILAPLGFSVVHLVSGRGVAIRKRILLALLSGLILSVSIEVIQYRYGGRYGDIDDVLLNTLGALVGAWVASRHERRQGLSRN